LFTYKPPRNKSTELYGSFPQLAGDFRRSPEVANNSVCNHRRSWEVCFDSVLEVRRGWGGCKQDVWDYGFP